MIGFAFHSSRKWQAARAVFVSVFAFVASCAMIFSDYSSDNSLGEIFLKQPALGFAAVLFLVFSLVLAAQLHHVLTTRFVLEFTDDAIVDHRRRRVREIPYSFVEIFSPFPEELFPTAELAGQLRGELGLDEYISISCHLRAGRESDRGDLSDDFIFFEKVATPSFEAQKQIVRRLREKISRFDHLVHDDGSGFGDDYTNP